VSESQGTSGEAGPRGETGEELFRKEFVPLGDQVKQLARLAQELFPLRTAELVWRDGTHETMTGGARIVRLDLLTACGQRSQLAARPDQHPPYGAVVQAALIAQRRLVAGGPASGSDRFAIRLPVVLQITAGEIKKSGTGVAFIRDDEREGNR